MAQAPVISVCIANYNGVAMLEECLRSVRSQQVAATVEIIVHDDASSDGSVEYLRRRDDQLRLIASDSNVGFCVANNRMAAVAGGDYLLLLNNDAFLQPGALALLLAEAQRIGGGAILSLAQYDADSGALLDIGSLLDPFFNPLPNLDCQRQDVAAVMGACLWLDAALWRRLGGFPRWFESIGEDLLLCCRARLAGYPVRALGAGGYRHRVGASFGGGQVRDGRLVTSRRRRALSERNKTFVMIMTWPGRGVWLVVAAHLLLLLLEGAALSLLKMDAAIIRQIYLPVFAACWRRRRRLLALRRRIAAERRIDARRFFEVGVRTPWKLVMLLRHGLPHLR